MTASFNKINHTFFDIHPRPAAHRGGSVLVIVVAILTLIALMGTAYIAVARLDRYAAVSAVQTAQTQALQGQFISDPNAAAGQVNQLVQDAIGRYDSDDAAMFNLFPTAPHNGNVANYASITYPVAQNWLADRLPRALDFFVNNPPTSVNPMWRFISGQLDPSLTYISPMDAPGGVPAWAAYLSGTNRPKVAFAPISISITYPTPFLSERPDLAGRTRTFPAFQIIDPISQTQIPGTFTFLAADATGSGIADSVLFQLSPAPIDGVMVYGAVRIIDNNSAINVNTARVRRNSDGPPFSAVVSPTGNPSNQSFFPTSVGLYELLDSSADTTLTPSSTRNFNDEELNAVDQFRFGYADAYTDPFKPSPKTIIPSLTAVNDPLDPSSPNPAINSPTFRNTPNTVPPATNDFQFTNQAEALYMQVGRRTTNPGYNYDPSLPAPSLFKYRAFDPQSDGASLAYKGGMVLPGEALPLNVSGVPISPMSNPGNFATEIDRRLWHSAFQSTPNFTYDPSKRWTTFPADQPQFWFLGLNFDRLSPGTAPASPPNGYYDYSTLSGVSLGALNPTAVRYRSIRPILTAYNPVSNLYTPKTNTGPTALQWGFTPGGPRYVAGNTNPLVTDDQVLYPGSMPGNVAALFPATSPPPASWYYIPGTTYRMYDVVFDNLNTQLWYLSVQPKNNHALTDPLWWEPQPKVSGNSKTSINAANFPELWRAYMHVMSDPAGPAIKPPPLVADLATQAQYQGSGFTSLAPPALPPSTPAGATDSAMMFRSPIRDPKTPTANYLFAQQMLTLRSAIAAVNTLALELPDDPSKPGTNPPPPMRQITMYSTTNPPSPLYTVTLFGVRKQPFITEVYANNDPCYFNTSQSPPPIARNPQGYVAIELYNPYKENIDIGNWQLATLDRSTGGYPSMQPVTSAFAPFPTGTQIPAGSYLIIENYNPALDPDLNGGVILPNPLSDATHRPAAAANSMTVVNNLPANQIYYAPLQTALFAAPGVLNASVPQPQELVLMRPVPAGSTAIPNLMPIDSFDFTGWVNSTLGTDATSQPNVTVTQWHYVPHNGPAAQWQFVYPGRYDASGTSGTIRQQGVAVDVFTHLQDPTSAPESGFDWVAAAPLPAINLGGNDATATYTNGATVPFTIQLNTDGMPGPNPLGTGPINYYPFGGFARNGDILQVPFIGSYIIQQSGTTTLLEFNSVTMDAAFADDADSTSSSNDDGVEQIGRFCPLSTLTTTITPATDNYGWASKLFTYIGVGVPAQDYLPDTNPATYSPGLSPPNSVLTPNPLAPQQVPSAFTGQTIANANQTNDDTVGTQGLININTAPPVVLKMLPMAPDGSGGVTPGTNDPIALTLAQYRDGTTVHPFTSILVSNGPNGPANFSTGNGTLTPPSLKTTAIALGDFIDHNGAGIPITTGGTAADFEGLYLAANRISNMVTTRSDSFTCYILVQGWRNANTAYPALEWEKRVAFIVDRSMRKGPTDTTPLKIIPVPSD